MALILSGDTGVPVTTVTGTLPVANGGSGVTTSTGSGANVLGTSPSISGAVLSTMASSVITSGASQASTSGTSIDFTGIPSWVKRITVMFNGVSTNGTSLTLLQLGTSGGIQTSGYVGSATYVGGGAASVNFSTGFSINTGLASVVLQGIITFTLMDSATGLWCMSATLGNSDVAYLRLSAGSKTLSGTLDRVRITTANGTDTFDAGSINILYE